VGSAVIGVDLLAGGNWWARGLLMVAAMGVAFVVKRRSIFKDRPEPRERDVVLMGFKTVLVVFGATLLATVLLQAVVEQPRLDDGWSVGAHESVLPPSDATP